MLSRFSTLLVYVVAGLIVSVAATPMGPPNDYDDGLGPKSQSPSNQGSSYSYSSLTPPKSPATQPYPKPNAEKPYPEKKKPEERNPQEKPYQKPNDKDKPSGDHSQYDKGKTSGDYPRDGNSCSTGKQECCNSYNESKDERHNGFLNSLGTYFERDDIAQNIRSSDKLWATNCSPGFGKNSACRTHQMCCEDNHYNGLIVVGCTDVNIDRPV